MSQDRRTIREMCEEFQVTPRTLRFYDSTKSKGEPLISPGREGNKRFYGDCSKAPIKLILRGKRFGFSLKEIRHLPDLCHIKDQQRTQTTRTCNLGVQHLATMKHQRADLDSTISAFEVQLKTRTHLIKESIAGHAGE